MPHKGLVVLAAALLALLITGCAGGPRRSPETGAAAPGGTPSAAPGPGRTLPPPPSVALAPPAGSDYKIAPKDQLKVLVHGQNELTRSVRVSESGTITLPLVGEIAVAGLSAAEAEQKIAGGLRGRYLKDPRVSVSVAEYLGRQIAVLGAVQQPGAYPLKSNGTTVRSALSEARGVRDNADRVAYVLRAQPRSGEPSPLTVDLDALLRSGDSRYDVAVEPGDSVYVPEANTFYVAGEVEKRGTFTLRRDTTLAKALTEAGGVTKRAATGDAKIIRTLPTGERQEITGLDVDAALAGDRAHDVPLQAQDVVVVPASGAKVAAYGFLDVLKTVLKFSLVAF
jgi:polysaccharide export outer membrane protein